MIEEICSRSCTSGYCKYGLPGHGAEGDAPTVKGNIEIYGAAKVSYDMIDTGRSPRLTKSCTRSQPTRRASVSKGSEDVGDGLNAVFQLELQVNLDGTQTTSGS